MPFVSEPEVRSVPRVVGTGAMASRLATTEDCSDDGTGTHILETRQRAENFGATNFQLRNGFGHEASFWKYYILPEARAPLNGTAFTHFHVAHPIGESALRSPKRKWYGPLFCATRRGVSFSPSMEPDSDGQANWFPLCSSHLGPPK